MARLRVAAILEAYTVTGPAKNLLRFARAAWEEVDLRVVTYLRGGAERNSFLDAAEASGVPVELVREKAAYDPGVLGQLRARAAAIAPDLVQTHSVKSHFLWRLAGGPRRYPWIAFHHGYTAENRKVRLYNQLDRWSLPAARRIVTVCEAFARELTAHGVGRDRIEVIPNAVEPFTPSGQPLENPHAEHGGLIVLHVGRFSSEKNHQGLLAAVARAATAHPGLRFQLVLVGDGVNRAQIESLARAPELAAVPVWFTGQQRDVRRFYEHAAVFVLPSHSEGSPNVILEAMAAGLPVAATRVGGIPDMVEDGVTGFLVDPFLPGQSGGEALFAERLARLLTDPGLRQRMGEQARARSVQFSPGIQKQRLLSVYRGL
jgi:glycosyltransferase involved in cell wall biosynthesis